MLFSAGNAGHGHEGMACCRWNCAVGAVIEIYEVMKMRARFGYEKTLLFAAAFLAVFLFVGWKFFSGEIEAFPIFSDACAWLDSHLEQARQGEKLYRAVGNFFREVIYSAEADLF